MPARLPPNVVRQSAVDARHQVSVSQPFVPARSGLFWAWDMMIFNVPLALDSMRVPERRHRRSGTRRRLILVAQILLPSDPRSSSMILKPAAFKCRTISRLPDRADSYVPEELPIALESHARTSGSWHGSGRRACTPHVQPKNPRTSGLPAEGFRSREIPVGLRRAPESVGGDGSAWVLGSVGEGRLGSEFRPKGSWAADCGRRSSWMRGGTSSSLSRKMPGLVDSALQFRSQEVQDGLEWVHEFRGEGREPSRLPVPGRDSRGDQVGDSVRARRSAEEPATLLSPLRLHRRESGAAGKGLGTLGRGCGRKQTSD